MFDDDDGKRPELMPLFKKGKEIYELTVKIVDLIENEDEILSDIKAFMLADASLLSVKVAGAEGGDLYDIRMENATLIRKAARDLVLHCRSLEMYDFKEIHYLDLIREAIEEYRVLFVEWVKTFNPWNYSIDRWGLFNPPGIDAGDADNEEDY